MKFIGKIYLPVILFGSCFFCVLSFADIIRIPEDNNSIQDAIDDSESGDTILIAPGEYEVSLEIEDHGLTLASEYLFDEDTTIIQETILSGSNNFRVIRIDSLGEDSVSIIGLTIANGMNLHPTDTGAGIICNGTRINLISNIIRNNYALYDAGGQLENCSGNIRNNLIIENIAESSTGGFQFVNCQMLIEANRFINNHSNSLSGGLKGHSGNLCIRNNLFEGNIARVGGGLELSFGSHIIVNNVFRGNTAHTDAGNGGGLYLYGTNHDDDPQGLVLIRDNVFVENTAGSMGGGLSVEAFFAEVEISGNKFEENRSPQGGALLITTSCDLFDNTFKNNNSQRGSIFSTSSVNGTNPVIYCYNNIFLNNLPEDDFIPFISAAHTFSRGQIYISNCDFSGNLPAAVGYSRETNQGTITALNCYWGDPSGPFHAIENPDGLGDSVDCDMDEEDFMPFSRQPISAVYKLATPDNCAEVNESPVLFTWNPPVDYLTGDSVFQYSLEIFNSYNDLDSLGFDDAVQYDAGADTFISIEIEDFENFYYWRVIAEGDNMPPVISEDTLKFIFSDGIAPDSFDLGEPDDFEVRNELPVLFTWQSAEDPTPGDTVNYTLEIAMDDTFDSSRVFHTGLDTYLVVEDFDFENAYFWRVYAEDHVYHRTYSTETREFHFTAIKGHGSDEIPNEWEFIGAYPNPFNSKLTIIVGLPERTDLWISIYDLLGRETAIILDRTVESGYRQFDFSAEGFASGIFFLRVYAPGKMNEMRKIVFVK